MSGAAWWELLVNVDRRSEAKMFGAEWKWKHRAWLIYCDEAKAREWPDLVRMYQTGRELSGEEPVRARRSRIDVRAIFGGGL